MKSIPDIPAIFSRKGLVPVVILGLILLGTLIYRTGDIMRIFRRGGVTVAGPRGFPDYRGRDLREWRENQEETKIFSADQKKHLRDQLENAANRVTVNPDQLDPWLEIGLIKKDIGDYEGARDAWEYAGIIRPKNVVSFKNLGELYWHYLPDLSRAEANFRLAIKNEPKLVDSYVSLSDLYRYSMKDKSSQADQPLLEGIKNNPGDASLMAYLAAYYKAIGERAKAIEWYQKVLDADPSNRAAAEELQSLR